MNQRSLSANRKLKTDLLQDISFDRKVARAIQEKKQTISKMFTPRAPTCLPTYRNTQHSTHIKQRPSPVVSQCRPPKQIKLTHTAIQSYLQQYQKSGYNCIIHPNKRAAFEDKEKRSDVYCHECAIKMVKNNYKMVGVNEQSTLFKCFVDCQLQLVSEQEARVEELVREYYNSVRNALQVCYREYIENKSNTPNFAFFAEFQSNNAAISKIPDNLGKLEEIKFKLVQQNEKDNKQNIAKEVNKLRNSIERREEKCKTRPLQVIVQLNRSFQTNKSMLYDERRSRQNSFCSKAEKHQAKRVTNLR